MERDVQAELKQLIGEHAIVLFMKGTRSMPQCGFSAAAVTMLGELNAPFQTVNVLADMEVRDGIKRFSDWPTIPQLYVRGQFIGGSDIMRDLFESGKLAEAVGQPQPA